MLGAEFAGQLSISRIWRLMVSFIGDVSPSRWSFRMQFDCDAAQLSAQIVLRRTLSPGAGIPQREQIRQSPAGREKRVA